MFIHFLFVLPVVVLLRSTTGGATGLPGGPDDQTCHGAAKPQQITVCRVTPMGSPCCMLLASGIYIGGGLIGLILLIVIIVLILR
jgi:hypothetical protein